MADKSKAKKAEKKSEAPAAAGGKPKRGGAAKMQIIMIAGMLMAAVFLPSSTVLVVGMLPTFAVLFANPRNGMTKATTVGALNLAGCVPFLLDLWKDGHNLDNALDIIMDPQAIIVMYAAAAAGYMIDWSMSAIIAGVLYQRGVARQKAIQARQEELVLRWGEEVTGQIPLDEYGFAIRNPGKEH